MKTIQKLMVLLVLTGICTAQTVPGDGTVAKKKTTHKVVKKVEPAASAEDVKQLKELIKAQQAQLDQLKQQMSQRDQQTQQAVSDAQKSAAAAEEKVAASQTAVADTNAKVDAVKSDVADLKTTTTTAVVAVQDTQARVSELEAPKQIHYKNIHITPGGFVVGETLWRQHAENTDIISSFNGIPYDPSTQAHLTEFRGTARQSRLSVLAEGKAGSAKLTGYWEMDFLGAAQTANENQSSSFNPRQRQLFGQVAMNGWTLTAGQTWSLITTNKKGIEARGEWVPATIDGQYVVGYSFARLMTARIAKSFAADKATVAFSVENPATLSGGTIPSTVVLGGTGSGSLGNTLTYSTNLAPDFIAKAAFDPGYGHYEIKALGRVFRDRVVGASNNTTFGGGIGAAAILPIMPKKVDFIAEGLLGRGTARYGDSSNVDVVVRPNGALSTVKNLQVLAGFEGHPTPKLDLYLYGGDEYLGRNYTGADGYGNPALSNTKCFAAESAFSCSANMKNLVQGTTGFWYNFYKGGYGSLRYGMQYSYTYKNTWPGVGGAPHANEAIVMSSFRYYIP